MIDPPLTAEQHLNFMEALRERAELALGEAITKRHEIGGAVNWGDLHVMDVEYYKTLVGSYEGYRVLIEEADPGATELQQFIRQRIYDAAFPFVEVVTEW